MDPIKKTKDLGPDPHLGGLWTYTLLSEPQLSSELARLAFAQTIGDTDVVSLQPLLTESESSEDRFAIHDINLPDGSVWRMRAIFDGHAGRETVDHVIDVLPKLLQDNLTKALASTISTDTVSSVLRDTILQVDNDMKQAFFDIFPDQEALSNMSDSEIKSIINDGGTVSATVLRCMRGTTALVSLVDPKKENVWVASLGDCQAVLGIKSKDSWETHLLSTDHNGSDPSETARIRAEHPGEEECIMGNRVLGFIAVTRALGDFAYKLPKLYTERVFLNRVPGFRNPFQVHTLVRRCLTPPYVSNIADVQHLDLSSYPRDSEAYLILCSDGLTDLYEEPTTEPPPSRIPDVMPNDRTVDLNRVGKIWVEQIRTYTEGGNLALHLLKQAMGGKDNDEEKVSRLLTAERQDRWMDDTTILVQKL